MSRIAGLLLRIYADCKAFGRFFGVKMDADEKIFFLNSLKKIGKNYLLNVYTKDFGFCSLL